MENNYHFAPDTSGSTRRRAITFLDLPGHRNHHGRAKLTPLWLWPAPALETEEAEAVEEQQRGRAGGFGVGPQPPSPVLAKLSPFCNPSVTRFELRRTQGEGNGAPQGSIHGGGACGSLTGNLGCDAAMHRGDLILVEAGDLTGELRHTRAGRGLHGEVLV